VYSLSSPQMVGNRKEKYDEQSAEEVSIGLVVMT
jgi:hypothetical protein